MNKLEKVLAGLVAVLVFSLIFTKVWFGFGTEDVDIAFKIGASFCAILASCISYAISNLITMLIGNIFQKSDDKVASEE